MDDCTIRYRPSAGAPYVTLTYDAARVWEIVEWADAKFLPPLTAEDERRWRGIVASDVKRRKGK